MWFERWQRAGHFIDDESPFIHDSIIVVPGLIDHQHIYAKFAPRHGILVDYAISKSTIFNVFVDFVDFMDGRIPMQEMSSTVQEQSLCVVFVH
jgi:hypothetical protein